MIKGSEARKQRPYKLLWMLWFDGKSISKVPVLREISVFDHQETLLLHLKGKVFLFYKTRIWTEKQDEIVRPVRMMRESDKRLDKQKLNSSSSTVQMRKWSRYVSMYGKRKIISLDSYRTWLVSSTLNCLILFR